MQHFKRRKMVAQINVVPFIDIVLVLLIVFMIASPSVTQGIKINLPKVTAEKIKTNESIGHWVLFLKADGSLFLDRATRSSRPQSIERSDLPFLIKQGLKLNPSLALYIKADAALPYGQIISLMGKMQSSGISRIGLITEPPN